MSLSHLTLITGSGRCGTLSLTRYLDGLERIGRGAAHARHETRFDAIARLLIAGEDDGIARLLNGFAHDIEVSPLIALFPARLLEGTERSCIALIRDGRETVRSGYSKTWYFNEHQLDEHWTNVLPRFPGDRFDRCCRYWAWVYGRLGEQGAAIFRLEDLHRDQAERDRLLGLLGLRSTALPFPHRHAGARSKWDAVNRGIAPLPSWPEWPRRHRETFTRWCGETMDAWYPEWRAEAPEEVSGP